MPALSSPALFLFQDAAASASDVHLIMIFTGIIAICILVVLIGLLLGALIAYVKISGAVKAAEKKAQPFVLQGQSIAGHINGIVADLRPKIAAVTADLQPKIASVTADVQHISALVRSKADEAGQTFAKVNDTVQDVNAKSKEQVQRVNGMVSDALTTTEHVSKQIQHGIRVPIQKIAEWVSAAKVGVEHLAERLPFLQHEQPAARTAPVNYGSARPTGTAAPGGPPFVAAPPRNRE